MEVLPGFRVELVAAEPLIRDPVAMDFDEHGRLYVVQMCDYSEEDRAFLGSVQRLEDTDGDGSFDRSVEFADDLSWPTAAICFEGGIFVGAAPHIYYMKDTNADGRADIRKIVFTGFGRSNVQGLLNSFRWGLDNRIHGATSSSGGVVTRTGIDAFEPIDLRGRDFSFDPRDLDLRPESGGGQHGMCFDDWGRKFVCSNSDHLQMIMFEERYAGRNRHAPLTNSRVSIAADGPQAEVFRISPVEPWRIVRTRMRAAGLAPGIVEGGGRPAGYFTGATGVTVYRGDAFPKEFIGQVFVGDVGSNLVHRKSLNPAGVSLIGQRVDPGREFLASRDIWFRPAQLANGPDGALYIADVYREVIEHPASIPPEIKQHLDLTSGRNRGRIYRVVPQNFRPRPLSQLSNVTTAELVKLLEHRNGWHRDTASRLLYERQDKRAVELLEGLAGASDVPEARLHAIYALDGLKALKAECLIGALADPHPRVREHGVRLAERFADDAIIRERLYSISNDEDPRVRYQLAFSLGELYASERLVAIQELARRDVNDRWMRMALLSSLSNGATEALVGLAIDDSLPSTAQAREFLERLAEQVGRHGTANEIRQIEKLLDSLHHGKREIATAILCGLVKGIRDTGGTSGHGRHLSPSALQLLENVLTTSAELILDGKQSEQARIDAMRTLSLGGLEDWDHCFAELLAGGQPVALQLAAVDQLRGYKEVRVAKLLIAAWPGMSPHVRSRALDAILSRPIWTKSLLDAVESGVIAAAELDAHQLRNLAEYPDPEIRELAARLTANTESPSRHSVVEKYQAALELPGDSDNGKRIFKAICASCHRAEDTGFDIGPSLAAMNSRGAHTLLLNILDPHREVNPQFINYVIVTTDGRTVTGLITGETAVGVTVTRAENQSESISRDEIETMWSTGRSIMPEGLEEDIDLQSMADLITYLMSLE